MKIREAVPDDAAEIARVHAEGWRSAYPGVSPEEYLEALSYEDWGVRRSAAPLVSGPRFTFVAEEATGAMVGYASGGADRAGEGLFDGEIHALYVREAARRRGAGRRLALAVATRLQSQGMRSLRAWLLADNPACAFYRALGALEFERRPVALGSRVFVEVALGWRDLDELVGAHGAS